MRVGSYLKNNCYVQAKRKEEFTQRKEIRLKNKDRINQGLMPEKLPDSHLRSRNEHISTQDIIISCIAQTALMTISLAITGGFIAFAPEASVLALPRAIKWAVISGVAFASITKFVISKLRNAPPELKEILQTMPIPIKLEEPPSLVKEWKDHFTMLAAYTPEGRKAYIKQALKSIVFNTLFLGVGTYFFGPATAAVGLAGRIVNRLSGEAVSIGVNVYQYFHPSVVAPAH